MNQDIIRESGVMNRSISILEGVFTPLVRNTNFWITNN